MRASGWGWRHAGRKDWAVRGLDVSIAPGERVLLLGASGSGKSTLLAALAGVLGGSEEGEEQGRITVDGEHPAARRGRSGLLMQDPDSQVVLARAGDDVAFGCENLGVPRGEIWPRVTMTLEAVGLRIPLDHPTSELSGGQKQRLALAGVIAMRPGLLLLDEPTANLDPAGVAEVRTAVADVVALSGATLIVVEHRVSIWSGYVDRVIALDGDGGLLADGTPDSVFGAHAARLRDAGVWLPHDDEPRLSVERRRSTTAASGRTLITAHNLSVGRSRGNPVVTELDISVSEASATAISGRNGAGKSTLALTLGGLIPPLGGAVVASDSLAAGAGTSPITWTSAQLLTRIGSVFQSPEHQFLASTVRKELAVGPRALRRSAALIDARVDELLVRLRLDALADANPFTLSGGQKRRLSVATALATMPKLLIFDEPTFGQDARTWRELIEIFHELVSVGHAIVAVTHDTDFVAALGARELTISAEGLSQHQYSAGSRDVGS